MMITSQTFYADKVNSFHGNTWQTLFQLVGASLLLALCSQIKIPLPFTVIPLTFQTLAVLLIGASLGSQKGAWAIILYYVEILAGMPVLSGGVSNPLIFFGPSGGYVLGFCFQAFVMGWMVEKMPWSRSVTLFAGGLLACGIQLALGVCMLAQFVTWNHVWMMGFFPFIFGEILKVLLVTWGFRSKES